jgi:uncharacterized damage-inducible protein DinB
MSETQRIAEELRRACRGNAWHGSSVLPLLSGVTAAQAAARPIAGAHSIWDLVLHMTGWTAEVRRRLEGGQPAMPAAGDWPAVPESTAEAWEAACRALAEAHEGLIAVVEGAVEERLEETVGTTDAPLGTGVTLYAMLHGLVQHDAYHGGQIALLKKALRL